MSTYTTQAKVEAYLGRDLTTQEEVNITAQIKAVSAAVANYLNRNYLDVGVTDTSGVTNTVRYYAGSGDHQIFIDDFISISSVELLDFLGDTYETVDEADDYILSPINDTIKDNIYLREYYFPDYDARAKVTGKFTSGVLPPEVESLVTAIVANNLTAQSEGHSTGSSGEFESESIEGYSYKRKKSGSISESNSISQYASIDHLRKITF